MRKSPIRAAALLLVAAVAAVGAADAPKRVYKIGALVCPISKGYFADLKAKLEAANPGRYVYTVYESMDEGQLKEYARTLLAEKHDVIVTTCYKSSGPMTEAAKGTQQPVLFLSNVGKSVINGELLSPSGNVTGISITDEDAIEGGIKALKEIVPPLAKIAVVANPGFPSWQGRYGDRLMYEKLAARLGIQIDLIEARNAIEAASLLKKQAPRGRYDALIAAGPAGPISDAMLAHGLREKIPTMSTDTNLVKAGVLVGSHPELGKTFWDKELEMVEKILSGVSPARIPVETPKSYLLSLNLETAKKLGLTVPESVRRRAVQTF